MLWPWPGSTLLASHTARTIYHNTEYNDNKNDNHSDWIWCRGTPKPKRVYIIIICVAVKLEGNQYIETTLSIFYVTFRNIFRSINHNSINDFLIMNVRKKCKHTTQFSRIYMLLCFIRCRPLCLCSADVTCLSQQCNGTTDGQSVPNV